MKRTEFGISQIQVEIFALPACLCTFFFYKKNFSFFTCKLRITIFRAYSTDEERNEKTIYKDRFIMTTVR